MTQQRSFVSQQKLSLDLSNEYFTLGGLLNGDLDGNLGEEVKLELFYSRDPKQVKEEELKEYKKQKQLANQIEDIYNKYKNDPFTKQIMCSFGYFEIEVPIIEEIEPEEEELEDNPIKPKTKIDRYPLFSIPINIIKESGRYIIYLVDSEIQTNIGFLEDILGEDLYYQLIEEISNDELDGKLTTPISGQEIFIQTWHKIKQKLKLKEANFDEDSFKLDEVKIALSSRSNYFLAEDLQKLSKLEEKDLQNTALLSWVDDSDLNVESGVPEEKELYFPFLYDKYQLGTLSLLKNKAAIIQGPPGTGKSETIANILCHLAATGNKVLFVSQKAQALKVVKDKLKNAGIKYLFGYLPNPASQQLGEEDEIDGIAPQLSALETHIENLGYRYNTRRKTLEYNGNGNSYQPSLANTVTNKEQLKENFQNTIDVERQIFSLTQELQGLKDFDMAVSDIASFNRNFSTEQFELILNAQNFINDAIVAIENYELNPRKAEFDSHFKGVNYNGKKYSQTVTAIKDDVAKTGYDKHSSLMRKINNSFRNSRLSKHRSHLPREIRDIIDKCLNEDISKIQATHLLDAIISHTAHYENIELLNQTNNYLAERIQFCGLTDVEFQTLVSKHLLKSQKNLEKVKEKIVRVYQIKEDLSSLTENSLNLNQVNKELKNSTIVQRQEVISYIQNIIDNKILGQWRQGITIKQIVNKLSKAFKKSKKAYKTFDNLRKDPSNFNAIRDLIPVWIMELDDASRIIPLEAEMFDYVVLDEASQCNVAYTLPVMFRSKHAVFVGDSEQMRDNTVMFKSNRAFDELAHRFDIPEEMQIKATGNSVQSVLEIAKLRGFMSAPLHYHYRSPRELINFSNKYFYKPKGKELIALNNNYLTYKNTQRVLVNHLVESDGQDEISDKSNIAEAQAILKLFKELRNDERYANKSIGILTFFNIQADCIRKLFEENKLKEERDNFKISIIEGIQGDEKDIIIYSFVISSPEQKNRYIALTGESGDIRADINSGRVNVAFSRARLQVHCFYSLPKMPEGIWLKKYIEYVDEFGKVDFYSTDLQPFDSYFEEEFYNIARQSLNKNFLIQNQVKSCGFKIDFVVSNSTNGKKLAIECDGPCHFRDEMDQEYGIYIDSDEERQKVLEAAGWKFYRIKYSDWIGENFDKKKIIAEISKTLN